jgi:putative ABC transport system permease protein
MIGERGGARMRPAGILHLYRLRARTKFVQEALAMLGIAVGVGLLFASQVANTSLDNSVQAVSHGLVGNSRLQLAARGAAGMPEALLARVQSLPDVATAAPVLEAEGQVIGPAGARSVALIGADPRFVRLGGRLLKRINAHAIARQRAVALPQPIAQQIGAGSLQSIEVQIGARVSRTVLAVALQEGDVGALVHSPVVLASLRYAQQLAHMPRAISRIFVEPLAGRDAQARRELERVAGDRLNVVPANFDSLLFSHAAKPTDESTALFAAISALVGFLFAFNAMLLTVPARRSLVADLRLDGFSSLTILEVLAFDALVLGLASSALGLALGDELSRHLFHTSPGYLSFAFPVGSQRTVTWESVAIAAGGGMLAACLGVLVPLLDLLARRPAARRAKGPLGRGAWITAPLGLACLAGTSAVLALAPEAALLGVLALTVSLLTLLPHILRAILGLVERVFDDVRARAPFVALGELRSTWSRTVGIAATGAVAVFGSVAIQGAHADLQRGLDRSARDVAAGADVWVFPRGLSNLLATSPFSPAIASRLERLPGVRAVWPYRGGFLDFGERRVWVSAQPVQQPRMVYPHQLVRGELALANARVRAGGWAVLSQALAAEHHLAIGDAFTLPSPRPLRLRVAALGTNVGWPPGAVLISAEVYARGWASQDVSALEVIAAPAFSRSVLREEIARQLGRSSGLAAQTPAERERASRAASRQGLSRLSQISLLVLIAAVLAMAAAIGNMIWQRRGRLGRLKLDGFADLAVWRMLLFESCLLVGSGCSIGALFGLYGQLLGSHAILAVTGFPVIFSLGLALALGSLLLVTAVAVGITALPGWLIARSQPAAGASS